MSAPGVGFVDGRKAFIPLENNPDVFTRLSRNLGISEAISFHDIFTLDPDFIEETLASHRPINALVFLCGSATYHAARSELQSTTPVYEGHGPSEPIIWIKQTIRNACGLMALLHCILNLKSGSYITPDSELHNLREKTISLPREERAQLVYESSFLENAHMDAAVQGSSSVPVAVEEAPFHFLAFVKDEQGKVWELNGGMPGPVERGFLQPHEDLLSPTGMKLTIEEFVKAAREVESGLGMSIVAVAENDQH